MEQGIGHRGAKNLLSTDFIVLRGRHCYDTEVTWTGRLFTLGRIRHARSDEG